MRRVLPRVFLALAPLPFYIPPMSHRLAANSALLTKTTAVSRVLGFARDLCIAATLGAGPLADAFFIAFRIPNTLRRLFADGAWSLAFVPAFMQCGARHGLERGFAMARSALVWSLILAGCLALVCALFPYDVTRFLAPGLRQEPHLLETTARLLAICAPYALCIMGTAVSAGLLNAMGHFLAPALAPVILNCTLILAALGAWILKAPVAYALAWGVLVAGILQWGAQQPPLARIGFQWRGPWRLLDPVTRKLGKDAGLVVFGVSGFQINTLLATLAATWLAEGAVSWLHYAERLVQLPLGVFSVAVSTAALPELAALAASRDAEAFDAVLRQALGVVLCISLPASAGLAALAEPIVALLFGHGAFSHQAVQGTAATLACMALGLPGFAALRPLASASFARHEYAPPVYAALLGLGGFLLLAWPLMQSLAAAGLALAVSLAGLANTLLLWGMLKRRGLLRSKALLTRGALLHLPLCAVLYAVVRCALALWPWPQWSAAPVLAPLLGLAYMWSARALGSPSARHVLDMLPLFRRR